MNIWHDIPVGNNAPSSVHVVVEIPKGSHNKYEYDKDLGLIRLDRVLYSSLHYPGDYGFIPQTLSDDNDPLDALVLVTNPTVPGCLINARPIGVLHMVDNGEGDEKVICVPEDDVRLNTITEIEQISEATRREIAHFFTVYKQLENKTVEVGDYKGSAPAQSIIEESVKQYNRKHEKK